MVKILLLLLDAFSLWISRLKLLATLSRYRFYGELRAWFKWITVLHNYCQGKLVGTKQRLRKQTYQYVSSRLRFICDSRLDGEHVAFGRAIQGMDTVFAIEGGAGTYNGKPRKKVIIVDSGEIPKDQWVDEWQFVSICTSSLTKVLQFLCSYFQGRLHHLDPSRRQSVYINSHPSCSINVELCSMHAPFVNSSEFSSIRFSEVAGSTSECFFLLAWFGLFYFFQVQFLLIARRI